LSFLSDMCNARSLFGEIVLKGGGKTIYGIRLQVPSSTFRMSVSDVFLGN